MAQWHGLRTTKHFRRCGFDSKAPVIAVLSCFEWIYKVADLSLFCCTNYESALHKLKKITLDFKVKLDGKRLVFQDCVNYLGVLIGSQLNWSNHQEKVAKSLRQTNGIRVRIRYYLPNIILKKVFFCSIPFNIDLCHSGLGTIIGL